MSKNLLEQIKSQKALSDGVMAALLPVIQEIHYPDQVTERIVCGDLGSFARGTNNDLSPDLDIGFFGATHGEAFGLKDWTPIGTRQLTGKKEGITTVEELGRYDPAVLRTIQRVQPILDAFFGMPIGSTQFNFMRSWEGYAGWVCNLSLPHAHYGTIEIDLNLGYMSSHYGIEHAQRFQHYFDRMLSDLGEEHAVQLIEDIKWVKKQGKENARDKDGWLDRTRKLAGFVVEGLFMHQYPPHSLTELLVMVRTFQWPPGQSPTEHWLGDQNDQMIDSGITFDKLLVNIACKNQALPLGAWENLKEIAESVTCN
jgi:hypothetical protein